MCSLPSMCVRHSHTITHTHIYARTFAYACAQVYYIVSEGEQGVLGTIYQLPDMNAVLRGYAHVCV
jgi:hypothetical protein